MCKWNRVLRIASILFDSAFMAMGQQNRDALQKGVEGPPGAAHRLVWWHWMSGNITKEGIKLDLEWMHRVGVAGFQNFDAALDTPQVVEHRQAYMTPEWKNEFMYATTLADQLGLEEAIALPGLERYRRTIRLSEDTEAVTLVPHGCAKLRVTIFPRAEKLRSYGSSKRFF